MLIDKVDELSPRRYSDIEELFVEKKLSPPSFDQYKLAIDLLEKESDRFWTRNNVFLLTQAALIAFYTGMDKSAVLFYKLLLSCQAFTLALIWMAVLEKGAKYVQRWDLVVREIERSLVAMPHGDVNNFYPLKEMNDNAKADESERYKLFRFLNHRTTKQIRYGIYSLLLFWTGLITYNLSPFVKPYVQSLF